MFNEWRKHMEQKNKYEEGLKTHIYSLAEESIIVVWESKEQKGLNKTGTVLPKSI